ncbi:MAG: uroporphyrinogen decarboxylase family protein [Armatimonadota bacterium]|nr:uroporphyrinogen decarboxylase family protein [Armatimonadota bacterium]
MTSRERILAAIRFDKVDRVPVSPWGMGKISPETPLGRELIQKTDIIIDVGPGSDIFLGKAARIDRRQQGDTFVTVVHTPKGDLISRYRRTEVTGATIEFFLKDPTDIEKALSIPFEPVDPDLSSYWKQREKIGDEGLVMIGLGNGVAIPASWFSPEGFCIAWADAPDMVERMSAVATERLIDFVKRCCKLGVDAFRICGGEYATVQLGPEGFRRLCIPYDKELIAAMHRYGAVAHYHNHGPVMRYLEFFAMIGMDSLDPLEAPPWGDADLYEARRRLGDQICFIGNLDDMEVIDKLPTEFVLAIARERLEAAGNRGFILGGTSSGTYGEKAARNFIAMAEMIQGNSSHST